MSPDVPSLQWGEGLPVQRMTNSFCSNETVGQKGAEDDCGERGPEFQREDERRGQLCELGEAWGLPS